MAFAARAGVASAAERNPTNSTENLGYGAWAGNRDAGVGIRRLPPGHGLGPMMTIVRKMPGLYALRDVGYGRLQHDIAVGGCATSMSNSAILFQGRRFRVERAVQVTPDGARARPRSRAASRRGGDSSAAGRRPALLRAELPRGRGSDADRIAGRDA